MKVVINRCFGGFGLSPAAEVDLYESGWKEMGVPVAEYFGRSAVRLEEELAKWREFLAGTRSWVITTFSRDEKFCLFLPTQSGEAVRSDPRLVEVVERMGEGANGPHAKLKIVEIPDGVEFEIHDYDGQESVREAHRVWR